MESKNIGFLGLGTMGKPMALRLMEAGFSLRVHNRTREKASDLLERGAIWSESPKALMEQSEIIISMVTDSHALEEIAMGDMGLLSGSAMKRVHVDMSTVSPLVIKRLERAYLTKQASFLHAPVLGSVPQAVEGSLLIFAGGDRSAASHCDPIFRALARRVWYFEEIMKASQLKLICNLFIASMITVLSEGLVLGQKTGIPSSTILEVLKESALGAPMYQTKGETIQKRNFTPRFMVAHMLKDLNLIYDATQSAGVPVSVVSAIRDLFISTKARGLQEEDYSAVVRVLEEAAQIEVKE